MTQQRTLNSFQKLRACVTPHKNKDKFELKMNFLKDLLQMWIDTFALCGSGVGTHYQTHSVLPCCPPAAGGTEDSRALPTDLKTVCIPGPQER